MSKTMASRLVASLRQARGEKPPVTAKAPVPSRTKAALKPKSKVKHSAKAGTRVRKTRIRRAKAKTRVITGPNRTPRRNIVRHAARFARQSDQAPSPASLDRPWENLHPERIWPD